MRNIEDVESFMLKHGESIVDTLGSEVDRIEQNLKVRFLTLAPTVTPLIKLMLPCRVNITLKVRIILLKILFSRVVSTFYSKQPCFEQIGRGLLQSFLSLE